MKQEPYKIKIPFYQKGKIKIPINFNFSPYLYPYLSNQLNQAPFPEIKNNKKERNKI